MILTISHFLQNLSFVEFADTAVFRMTDFFLAISDSLCPKLHVNTTQTDAGLFSCHCWTEHAYFIWIQIYGYESG